MPYTTQLERRRIQPELEELMDKLGPYPNVGTINYVVSMIIWRRWKWCQKYWNGAAIIGTLVCVILEFYRRMLAKHEDKAIKQNGDLKIYD